MKIKEQKTSSKLTSVLPSKEFELDLLKSSPRTQKRPAGCTNRECRLRVYGCTGFEGCPGYKSA